MLEKTKKTLSAVSNHVWENRGFYGYMTGVVAAAATTYVAISVVQKVSDQRWDVADQASANLGPDLVSVMDRSGTFFSMKLAPIPGN